MLGLGNIVEKACDAVGLPEWVGDVAGIATDYSTGNWAGVAENGIDLAENAGLHLDQVLPEPLARAGIAYLELSAGEAPVDGLVTEQLISAGMRA